MAAIPGHNVMDQQSIARQQFRHASSQAAFCCIPCDQSCIWHTGCGDRKQAALVGHLDEEGESPVELAREDATTWPA